jgi:integrase
VKSDAKDAHDERRGRARREPGWCPRSEPQRERERARQEQASNTTVRQFAERWLTFHVDPNCREHTAEQYRSTLTRHVYPSLGDVPLGDLKRRHIKDFFAAKDAEGLARGTLKNIWVPLCAMLNAAVEDELIPGNPAARHWKRQRGRTERGARKVTALTAGELSLVLGVAARTSPSMPTFYAYWRGPAYGSAKRAGSSGTILI